MVANKYAFLQITRRRFLNEWEAFKKVISRSNIRRRITIPLTLSNLKLLRRITISEERFSRNAETDLVCRLLLEKKNRQRRVLVGRDRGEAAGARRRDCGGHRDGLVAAREPTACHRYVFLLQHPPPPQSTLFPYTTLFRSSRRNIRRRITIPLTLSNLKLLRRIT